MESETSSQCASDSTVGDVITLQVGDRRFVTLKVTLTQESGFFSSLLSGRWENQQPDGSYFIDADGDLFEHILRYLRRGVIALFYDNVKGHDYSLYLALLEEARYFQIKRLEKWLVDKQYLRAVKVVHTVEEVEDLGSLAEVVATDTQLEYHPFHVTEKLYLCPRGISAHRGNPDLCERPCRSVRGTGDDDWEDVDVLKIVVIRRQTVFSEQICTGGWC